MPLTPSQILSANHVIFGSSGDSSLEERYLASKRGGDRVDELLDPKESPDAEKRSPSILERVKETAFDVLEPVGVVLDAARAGVVAGAVETGDLLRPLVGKEGDASFSDLRENFNRRIGVGDVLEENTLTQDLPLNVKRGLGLVGDIATDPLNFVTLGASAPARQGLARIARGAGDDVAEIAAREGVEAANRRIAEKAATEANSVSLLPSGQPATVQDILAQGVSSRGARRALQGIERTGRGGIGVNFGRLGGGTVVPGETLRPLGAPFRAAGTAARGTETGQALRRALIPLSETRDKFGRVVADAMPGIVHRRSALVDAAKADLDNQLKPILRETITTPESDAIRAALDVGGTYEEAAALLADNPSALRLLDTLTEARDQAYDTLIAAGKSPDDLMSRGEYLRHILTKEGAEMLGVTPGRKGATRSGRFRRRTREGSIDELMDIDGVASYVDDPVKLVRSSFHLAQEVGGNAMAARALEDLVQNARNLPQGIKPTDVIRNSYKEGFTELAPGKWINETIYEDAFNLAKSGTQNAIVRGWDTFSSLVKRQTLFNPVSFGPYFTQNMATGIAMNAVDGVRAADYGLAARLHRASARALKEGGEKNFDESLARILPNPQEQAYVKELRSEGLFGPGHALYDDIAEEGPLRLETPRPRRVAQFGTNHTVKVNAWGEEILRGSAYLRNRLNGMTADQAAALTRKRHLDYTAIGRTAFERNAINRFVFFPTWLMRAPAAIVRAYAHAPGAAQAQARLEMGTDWYERERNQYGELIGPRLSGPLSFLTSLPEEGSGEPVELLNPLARAVLDKDARSATEIVPPLANVMSRTGAPTGGGRLGGVIQDDERRSRYLRSLGGVRTGADYQEERGRARFEQELEERVALRQEKPHLPELTESLRLKAAAIEAGVEQPYSMTNGELARALIARGLSRDEVEDIIEG